MRILKAAIHVVRLDGTLNAARYPELRASLQAVPSGAGAIIVDMRNVTALDSTVLAELLISTRRWERDGRKIVTVVTSAALRRTLMVGLLVDKLHVCATVDEAVSRLQS